MMESRVPTGMLPAPIGTQSQGDFPSGHPACFLRLCIYKPHFAFDILSLENIKAPQLPSCMRMKVAAVFILHRQIVILYFQHSRHKVCSTSSIYWDVQIMVAPCSFNIWIPSRILFLPYGPLADPSARKWVILNVTRYYALILQNSTVSLLQLQNAKQWHPQFFHRPFHPHTDSPHVPFWHKPLPPEAAPG